MTGTPGRAQGLLWPRRTRIFPELNILLKYIGGQVGWDSSVGTATRYGLDGPGIETRWGREFPHPSRPALGPTQPPIQWVPGLSRGKSGRGVALTTHSPSRAEVEGRVELYLYSPSGPSWPVLGWTLPLPLHRRTDLQSPNLATANVSTPKVWTVTMLALRTL